MTIEEFLIARTADIGRVVSEKISDVTIRDNIETLLNNQYLIIDWHRNWPVLVETKPEVEITDADYGRFDDFNIRMSQQLAFLTQEEYKKRFGEEPPTAPLLRQMAAAYSWHPDFDPAWEV